MITLQNLPELYKNRKFIGIVFLFFIGFIILISIDDDNQEEVKITDCNTEKESVFEKYSNDSTRSRIFILSYNNKSTAPNYIVFKAKNSNTGEIKEICSEAPFLSGAMHRELEIKYDKKGTIYIDSLILKKRNNIYEFSKKEALDNISFFDYPDSLSILKIAKELDLENYHKTYANNDSSMWMHFETDTGFEQKTFSHIMFKIGVMTRRSCEAGNNICLGN
jgi:hypothetical protein